MVGQKKTSATDATYLKKVRKPLVEKKRRDRINNSLSQLKTILTQTLKQHGNTISRLDKADILEMTVRHLTLQQQQQQQQQSVTKTTQATSYSRGFKDCARETMRYLKVSETFDNKQLYSLHSHLFSVYMTNTQDVTALPPDKSKVQDLNRNMHVEELSSVEIERKCNSLKQNMFPVGAGPIIKEEAVWRPW